MLGLGTKFGSRIPLRTQQGQRRMDTLNGMGVVVTGGLGVLGLSVGQLLLQRGARVVLQIGRASCRERV